MNELEATPSEATEIHNLERELVRLPEVSAARIVTDNGDRPVEVHILAAPGKQPKQLVRDVQSVAMAEFGIELDRRIISVVQIGYDDPTALVTADIAPRAEIVGIVAENTGTRSLVRVTLRKDAEEATGYSEGSIATSARYRLVAIATLDALRQLIHGAETIDIDAAQIVRVGQHDVAVVTAVLVDPPVEQSVVGSAIVRMHQDADAVVRGVLDAVNRKISRL